MIHGKMSDDDEELFEKIKTFIHPYFTWTYVAARQEYQNPMSYSEQEIWVQENCRGKFVFCDGFVIFQSIEDATFFKLLWG